MGNWQGRDTKLRQRQVYKEFSKPFKKKLEKDQKKKERQHIREAQRAKYDSMDEDDETLHE